MLETLFSLSNDEGGQNFTLKCTKMPTGDN